MTDGKGISGRGRLTNTRIDAIQSLYGYTIQTNKGDPEKMSKGTQVILKHYSSTSRKPQHGFCPKGKESWCKYQVDKAQGTKTYCPVKNPIAPAIQKVIEPIFKKLGDKKFLDSVKKLMSSNANESYHNVLWGLAPKERFSSPKEVRVAVWLSVRWRRARR